MMPEIPEWVCGFRDFFVPKYPVAPYERSRHRSEGELKQRYPNVRFDETMNVQPYLKWQLHNMDRDHYTFRYERIWFSNNESLDPSNYKHHELQVKTLALRSITAV